MSDELREATARVAQPRANEQARTEAAFVFRLNDEWYALPTAVCERVVDDLRTHSVPHRRGGVLLGIGSVGGDMLPVISLAAVLGSANGTATATAGARALLVRNGQSRYALPVSEVHGIHRFAAEDVRPLPATLEGAATSTDALLTWNGRSVGRLDADRMFAAIARGLA